MNKIMEFLDKIITHSKESDSSATIATVKSVNVNSKILPEENKDVAPHLSKTHESFPGIKNILQAGRDFKKRAEVKEPPRATSTPAPSQQGYQK